MVVYLDVSREHFVENEATTCICSKSSRESKCGRARTKSRESVHGQKKEMSVHAQAQLPGVKRFCCACNVFKVSHIAQTDRFG